MEWQPISTAPKDGTEIDLWIVREDGTGYRVPDARWTIARTEYGVTRDGWVAPGQDYGDEGFCDGTKTIRGRIRTWTPVYWMPVPNPPVPSKKSGS